MRGELVGNRRTMIGRGEHIAARDIDFACERHRHRRSRAGALNGALRTQHVLDPARLPRRQDDNRIARRDRTGRDRSSKAAEIGARPVHPLHGHPERLGSTVIVDLDRLQVSHQRRATVPGRPRTRRQHVIPEARGQRNRPDILESERRRERGELGNDPVKNILTEIDEVDLIDRQHHIANAEQTRDHRVPSRLRHQPFRRIDQDHGEIAVRCPGRHVARILFMPRRIGDDEMAARCREITIGDVDGDALLALGLEAIEQQREIDILTGRAVLARIALQRRHVIVEDQTLLIK